MVQKQSLANDVLMRSIKIVDIGYVAVLYIATAVLCAKAVDRWFGEFDEKREKTKSKPRLTLEFVGSVWAYGILVYAVRNVIEKVPFPLDKYHGFDHFRVKEVKNATVFTLTFLIFSKYLKDKLLFYYEHVF